MGSRGVLEDELDKECVQGHLRPGSGSPKPLSGALPVPAAAPGADGELHTFCQGGGRGPSTSQPTQPGSERAAKPCRAAGAGAGSHLPTGPPQPGSRTSDPSRGFYLWFLEVRALRSSESSSKHTATGWDRNPLGDVKPLLPKAEPMAWPDCELPHLLQDELSPYTGRRLPFWWAPSQQDIFIPLVQTQSKRSAFKFRAGAMPPPCSSISNAETAQNGHILAKSFLKLVSAMILTRALPSNVQISLNPKCFPELSGNEGVTTLSQHS